MIYEGFVVLMAAGSVTLRWRSSWWWHVAT